MNFEVFGPFQVNQSGNGTIDRSSTAKREFWDNAEKQREGLRNAHGCYVFVIKAGSAQKSWYVGKSQKQKFKNEIFTKHKIDIYNSSIKAMGGDPKPSIYLIARLGRTGTLLPSGAAPRTIDFLEVNLIGMAYASNRELENRRDTKILRELKIPGLYTPTEKGASSQAALKLAKILQLPKKTAPPQRS
jgi:hypothetical protein